jgi:Fic family protein
VVSESELHELQANPDLAVEEIQEQPDGRYAIRLRFAPPHPTDLPARVEAIMIKINERLARGDNPVHVAADAEREFGSVHPFRDGNGRVSFLLMNYVLERAGLPPSIVRNIHIDRLVPVEEWRREVAQGFENTLQTALDAWSEAIRQGSAEP